MDFQKMGLRELRDRLHFALQAKIRKADRDHAAAMERAILDRTGVVPKRKEFIDILDDGISPEDLEHAFDADWQR